MSLVLGRGEICILGVSALRKVRKKCGECSQGRRDWMGVEAADEENAISYPCGAVQATLRARIVWESVQRRR